LHKDHDFTVVRGGKRDRRPRKTGVKQKDIFQRFWRQVWENVFMPLQGSCSKESIANACKWLDSACKDFMSEVRQRYIPDEDDIVGKNDLENLDTKLSNLCWSIKLLEIAFIESPAGDANIKEAIESVRQTVDSFGKFLKSCSKRFSHSSLETQHNYH